MNIKDEYIRREKQYDLLNKELRRIRKAISEIGNCGYIDIACELVEKQYNMPCRYQRGWINLYKKYSTPKQIQFHQNILGCFYVSGDSLELNCIKDEPVCFYVNIPNSTEELYELLINSSIAKTYNKTTYATSDEVIDYIRCQKK